MKSTDDPVQIECPQHGCRKRYAVSRSWTGRTAKCAACGELFVVAPDDAATPMRRLAITPPPSTDAWPPQPPPASQMVASVDAAASEEVVVAEIVDEPQPMIAMHGRGTPPNVSHKLQALCPYCMRLVVSTQHLAWRQVACPFCRGLFEMPGDPNQLTWLDRQLCSTNGCSVALLIFICNGPALVLGIIGLLVCKHPKARDCASNLTWGGGAFTLVGITLAFFRLLLSNPP